MSADSAIETELNREIPAEGAEAASAAALDRAAAEGLVDVAYTVADTPIGGLLLASTERGLVCVSFHDLSGDAALEQIADRVSPRVVELPRKLDAARFELDEFFAGRRRSFEVALDWTLIDGFRRHVLQRLAAEVGYGEVASYGELATVVGKPRAARAVGTAMATNPLPIFVPCHRVVRSGGAIGNYGGGVERKRFLLDLEGASRNH
ncbi:MAG: methylated-DNA--[protein]-cysteine S-methyltransferase [Thermoleophilaceae bacterium]|nr:methylated-DNA--[protein]-cysteine S-methyltransferase [Thermoleophilaceae bacterium]